MLDNNTNFRFDPFLFFLFISQFLALRLFEGLDDVGIFRFEPLKTAVLKQIDRSLKLEILFVCDSFVMD